MCNFLEAWKLPDDSFYPISMVNPLIPDQQQTVIVVCSTDQVFSLVVSDFNDATGGVADHFQFAKCDPETSIGAICGLKSVAANVVVVETANGKLMVYDYLENKLGCVENYSEIRPTEQGSENHRLFVVSQKEDRTVMEVIDTTNGFAPNSASKSYEIVAECIDSRAKFFVRSFTVNETNQRFLGDFLGFSKLSNGEEVILIAIYNQLFWLQQRSEDDCDLITVRCFSSNVVGFEFSECSICLTVLLEAGVLVVFNQSLHPDTVLVSNSFVYLQAPIEAHAFDKANNSFLYSNGLTTHRVRYHFSEETKQLVTETEDIPVCGVVAITLIENREMALLLTENRQFYTLRSTGINRDIGQNSSRMLTLRKEMRGVTKRVTKILTDEVEYDTRLDQAIQCEHSQFNVLALYRNKDVFSRLSLLELSFHQEMPATQSSTVLINGSGKEVPLVFASVKIKVNLGFFDLLREQKRWTVCLEYDESVAMYPVQETFDGQGMFHATVFLYQSQLASGLPTFRASLFASVRNGEDNLLLTIPVPTSQPKPGHDTGHLIRKLDTKISARENRSNSHKLVHKNNPHAVEYIDRRILTYCIQNDHSKTKAVSFSSALENNTTDTWSVIAEPVSVSWQREREALLLQTHHPVAMDLVKRFLLSHDEYSTEMKQREEKLKGMCLELQDVSTTEAIVGLFQRSRCNDIAVD
ncbi:AGAP009911-PA-like protein [Anopheles sinensis]|uniref:AGAP009911-PA-like protein n=1 Tax=Anopheles sinensis TaxID=74873 RepID=A0A084W8N7_ANOSI|nr:AGAP009911-PA-like protein [Anopheles sinensis]